MNIQAISSMASVVGKNSFTGISRVVSSRLKETIDCGGGQGMLDRYEEIVEYRPFKDETKEEIRAAIEKLQANDRHDNANRDFGSNASWTEIKVVLGKPLDCTKEAAKDILNFVV